jgi:glutamate dehydrogenase/leucine dehydrogenase
MAQELNKRASPYDIAQKQGDIIGQYLDVEDGLLEKLKQTKRDLIVHFPVRMDDGSMNIYTGYRLVHNDIRAPRKNHDPGLFRDP